MKIEITPKTPLVFVINGTDYPVKRPTLGAALDMEENVAAAKAAGKSGARELVSYLVSCGLPDAVVRALEVDDMELIVGALTGPKKK